MTREFDIAIDKVRVAAAVDSLAKWSGLPTSRQIAEAIALRDIQGLGSSAESSDTLTVSRDVSNGIKLLLDASDGAPTTPVLVEYLRNVDASTPETTDNILGNVARIFSGESINTMLPRRTINLNPNSPSKESPGLSVMFIKHAEALIANTSGNNATIVLNSIPNLEWARAVPFFKVTMMFGRDPIDGRTNRIQTMSLIKFLDGAREITDSDNTTRLLVDANTVSGSLEGSRNSSGELATAGLELFTSPQTLVNADEVYDPTKRAGPIIDRLQPFMTMKELDIQVSPAAAGMISYKVAKLTLILHDRSRMNEIAEFIKPDMYGATEFLIEYGWSHPDTPYGTQQLRDNPYGTIINGLRSREKYGIRNSSFTLQDGGKVGITLELFMKGGNECFTETIAGAEPGTNNVLRDIESIVSLVRRYERQTFGDSGNTANPPMREIRGQQVFQAANDFQSNLRLTPGLLRSLTEVRRDLNRAASSRSHTAASTAAARLRDELERLFRNRSANGDEGQISRLYTTTQQSIQNKINALTSTPDVFIPTTDPTRGIRDREHALGTTPRGRGRPPASSNNNNAPRVRVAEITVTQPFVSLGKLLLMFVGQPLAETGKFDDVQLFFYPFNAYAGFANTLNISQFKVDTRFFIEQFTRFRTESAARSANVSLSEFLQFISATIIDDPAAISYGLSNLYYSSRDETTGEQSVRPRSDAATFQTELQQRLRDRTPDASFKMPRVDFYIESSPGKTIEQGVTTESLVNQTILRIHVFDRQASKYDTQMNILASAREDTLLSISSIPNNINDGEESILQSYRAVHNRMRQAATQESPPLIVEVPNQQSTTAGTTYAINGGPKAIKDFIMKTMPYIIYGIEGSAIVGQPNLSSMQNSELSTVNMMRSLNTDPLTPNGEQPGGIPLSVLPCELNIQTLGCPILSFGQQFFVDFQTGVTADNVYGIVGLSHKFSDKFRTDAKFVPIDAYGRYSSFVERINQAAARLPRQ